MLQPRDAVEQLAQRIHRDNEQQRSHHRAMRDTTGEADILRRRLVHAIRALGRPLHSSEYELVTQFSNLVPPRLVPPIQRTGGFGGSNRAQAGAHKRIERDPVMIAVRAQCGLQVRDLTVSAKRDVQ
ncbi:hypothetical protein TRVL_06357 [Trypanosoma vivax]|nr:hypothetical protein TRVL_06357 [Trypanosoma vivax]